MHQCTGLVLVRVVLLLKLYSSQGKVSKLYFSQLLCLFRNTVVSQLHCKMYLVFYFELGFRSLAFVLDTPVYSDRDCFYFL